MALDDNLKDEELAGGFDASDSETFLADRLDQQIEQKSISNSISKSPNNPSRLLIIPLILIILSGLAIAFYYSFFYNNNIEIDDTILFYSKKEIANDTLDKSQDSMKNNNNTQTFRVRNAGFVPYNSNFEVIIADNYHEREKTFKNENFFYEELPKGRYKKYPKFKIPIVKQKSLEKKAEKKPDSIIPPKLKGKVQNNEGLTKKEKPISPIMPGRKTQEQEKKQEKMKITTKKEDPMIQKQTSPEKSEIILPESGNYTIQLLATPSKEEADIVVNKMRAKNIPNIYISTQKKRDIIWYRIRIGNFKTMNEAQEVAKTYGWTQIWIDRIK